MPEVAGDLEGHGRTYLGDGGDELALFGTEGNIFEEGFGVLDVFGHFGQGRIREEREEILKGLHSEARIGRDGGEGQEQGTPMGRIRIEGAVKWLAVEEVKEDGGGVGLGGHGLLYV